MEASSSPTTLLAKEWDTVRAAFAASIMVDTPLASLAQNLEGPDWPIKGKDETPASYIDLTYEEVQSVLVSRGQSREKAQLLVTILRETLAFDTPFGDMVAQNSAAAERDNPLLKSLARLEIPEAFPVEFTALSTGTLEFCRLEKLATLGQFAVFAQQISQNVIVGGDFRGLLNALSHLDETGLAKYLPFRPGTKGLHLIEAVAHSVRALPADQRLAITQKSAVVSPALRERVSLLVAYFADESTALRQQIVGGTALTRLVLSINDPIIEPIVVSLLAPHLQPSAPPEVAKKSSWWSRLFSKR